MKIAHKNSMERARKMIVLPEETVQRMQGAQMLQSTVPPAAAADLSRESTANCADENTVQTRGDNFSRLDVQMHEILHSKKITDEREKCLNYLQVLRRYLFFKETERDNERDAQRVLGDLDEALAPLGEEAILESVPKIYVKKARLLLRHWRTVAPDRLKWDNEGTVSIDGREIDNSNITELLNDVIRKTKRKRDEDEAPIGRLEFAKFLKTSETPSKLIGNAQVLRIGEVLTAPSNTAKRRLSERTNSMSPVLTRRSAKQKWIKLNI